MNKTFEIGKLYTFPRSYNFLFEKYEYAERHIKLQKKEKKAVIKEYNSRYLFVESMDSADYDNPENNSFFTLDIEASYFLPYRPFVILEYHYRENFWFLDICFMKILVEEKIFWVPLHVCLFDFDVIIEYTHDMIDKTPKDSLKLFDK